MHLRPNVVAGTMYEGVAIARSPHHRTHGVVYLPALDPPPSLEALAQQCDPGVARVTDDRKETCHALRNLSAEIRHPGVVGDDALITWHARAEVQQQQIALAHRAVALDGWAVVRIACVAIDGAEGVLARIKMQPLGAHQPRELLLRIVLGQFGVAGKLVAQPVENAVARAQERPSRFPM